MQRTFAQFLRDPELSGPDFQAVSMAPWQCLAKVISGEPLTRKELRLFRQCTGLAKPRPGMPIHELILLCGRRAGKSKFLSAFAVWVALFAEDWTAVLSQGERGVILLLAVDKKQARILSRYAAGLCAGAIISPWVERLTADEIEFATGAVIEVGVNDDRTVRGRTVLALIGDEACYWAAEGEGRCSDEEVVAAVEPSMATVPGGGWIMLSSSPLRRQGLMHDRWKALFGVPARSRSLCWHAATRTMNPTVSEAYIKEKLAKDPIRGRCEYLAEWRSADADFVPGDAIEACTDWEVGERPIDPGVRYVAFTDGAGGTGADSFTLGIAHSEPDGRVVLDCLRERLPRFVPREVVAEFSAVMKAWGVREVVGDNWAVGFVKDEFARNGVTFRPSRRTRSEIYLAGLPLLLSGQARLLDNKRLRDQLAGLERRVHAGGREAVDHGRGARDHDDLCNSAVGALVTAGDRSSAPVALFSTYVLAGARRGLSTLSGSYSYG